MTTMTLASLGIGELAEVADVSGEEDFRQRLLEMGLAPGIAVRVIRTAPLGDPIEIELRGFHLSLRRAEASRVSLRAPSPPADPAAPSTRSAGPAAQPPATSVETATTGGRSGTFRVAVAGNPNTGKTTLFNHLTGARARVGNYPGTTVDLSRGVVTLRDGRAAELIDVPGTYSLNARSREEQIAIDELLGRGGDQPPDAVIVLLNATALERSLYLLLQIRELGLPTIAVINMVDEARSQGIEIDADELARHFGVPCAATVARRGTGLDHVRQKLDALLSEAADDTRDLWHWQPPPALADALDDIARHVGDTAGPAASAGRRRAFALWCLMSLREDDDLAGIPPELRRRVLAMRKRLSDDGHDLDLEVTRARYRHIDEDAKRFIRRPDKTPVDLTDRIDAVLTHPVAGLLVFLALMALVFTAIFDWAAPLMDGIDAGFAALSRWLGRELPASALSALLAEGVVGGVGAVVVFLPQILILLLLLTLLEGSGYMARAAFLIDRLMRKIGLHGKAFIPMVSGYACAIPAVLATRTMERRRDRLLTMAAIPLISCSARLPVYTLIIGTLLPAERAALGPLSVGTVTMIVIYLVSTGLALVAASIIGRTVLKGERQPLLIELPPYRWPSGRSVALLLWRRALAFLKTAGTVIVVASVILWALLSFPRNPSLSRDYAREIAAAGSDHARVTELEHARKAESLAKSYAGRVGHALEPLLEPLGFDWKIGVGLIGAFAAREVFVATMGLVYGAGAEATEQTSTLRQAMRRDRRSNGAPVYTPLTGISLIVFFMIAMQCLSTLAVIRQESRSWRWPLFVLTYLTGLAYVASLLTYQIGRALGFS